MRPMAYIASAAVGLITPVALALPALAQPIDNDDDTRDGTGDISISADQENGDVTFSIQGTDLDSSSDFEITSSDVNDNCDSDNLDGLTESTDEDGNLDLEVSATNCDSGTYTIEIAEQDEPFETFSETVTID